MRRVVATSLLLAALTGCNRYDMFRLAGYQQESFSNRADILFVIDNTDTMKDSAAALATNIQSFVDRLQTQEEDIRRESLSDAVDNYKGYVQDRAAYLDYQIAVTTGDVNVDRGLLKGSTPILRRDDPDLADEFVHTVLCESTCFRPGTVPDGAGYSCGDPLEGEVTAAYLDCVCGPGTWEDANCATTGREEGLETVLMAMCAAVPNPPAECFEPTTSAYDPDTADPFPLFTQADVLANEGLLRPRSTFIPVLVTDEGDDSRRQTTGEPIPEVYKSIFERFGVRTAWVVIGPPLEPDQSRPAGCFGYPEWAAVRYDYMVRISDGLKIPIFEPDGGGGCPNTDFDSNLEKLGELLANLLTEFKLQSVPDPDTILVFVEGEEIGRAEIVDVDVYGLPRYDTGFTYEPETNSIRFHGAAVPPNDALVQVYYAPLDGMPRDLPF